MCKRNHTVIILQTTDIAIALLVNIINYNYIKYNNT